MDKNTRDFIESRFDRLMKAEILRSVKWIQREIPFLSLRDLAIGYLLGSGDTLATVWATFLPWQPVSDRDMNEIKAMLKRRLPEIIEKIEGELAR